MKNFVLGVAAASFALAAALVLALPVHADDCGQLVHSVGDITNPQNLQDCMHTGAAYSATIGAVVAGAGVVIAIVGLPGGGKAPAPPAPVPPGPAQAEPPRRETEDQQPHNADPCFDQQNRVTTAQVSSRISFNALSTLRNQRNYLDNLHETTRQIGTWNTIFDSAMILGGLWTREVATVFNWTVPPRALAAKVAEAMFKAFGKEVAKDLVKQGEDQGITWSDLIAKPMGIVKGPDGQPMPIPSGGPGKIYTESIKKALTQLESNRLGRDLMGTGRVPDSKLIEQNYSGPVADSMAATFGLITMSSSALHVNEKLEAIRHAILDLDDRINTLQDVWETDVNELDLAHDSLDRCRALHGPAGT